MKEFWEKKLNDNESNKPISRPSRVNMSKVLVAIAAFSIALVFIFGVARKEACSTAVGSVTYFGNIYSPCDLVGTAVGISMCAIISSLSLIFIKDQKSRQAFAVVSIVVFVSILIGGLGSIS